MTTHPKTKVPGELLLLGGMIMNSFAISLFIKANFGISALDALPYVMSLAFPNFTNGIWNAIIQSIWLVITMIAIRKFKPGYIVSFVLAFIFGFLLNGWASVILTWGDQFAARIVYFAAALVIITIGVSCFLLCGTPVLPFDTVVRAFTMEKSMSVRKARTGFDVINLVLTLAVSLLFLKSLVGIGFGTLASVLLMGTLIGKTTEWMKARLDIKPKLAWLGKLV